MSGSEEQKYNPEVRDELDKADWQEVLPRLLKYAKSKARMFHWLGIVDLDPEDLVGEAISRAYGVGPNDTYRNWNRDRYPELAGFLISTIKSITNHKLEHFYDLKSGTSSLNAQPLYGPELNNLSPNNPEQLVIEKAGLLNLRRAIYESVQGDEEVEMVLLCIEDGLTKPRKISEETGYEINIVNNTLKRLRRKIKALRLND